MVCSYIKNLRIKIHINLGLFEEITSETTGEKDDNSHHILNHHILSISVFINYLARCARPLSLASVELFSPEVMFRDIRPGLEV